MKLSRLFFSVTIAFAIINSAGAATEYVGTFGENGWYSWDTRNTSGTNLVGTNDTSPAWPGAHTAADDAAIGKQIVFMNEGETVNNAQGGVLPPGPLGSLNGGGYVRLDGTNSNSGKSDLSYVSTTGIAPGSALLDPSFGLSFRFWIQEYALNDTFRTLGLNISLTNNTQSNLYTFAYVDPAAALNIWNNSSVSATSGLFSLFANGSPAESGATKTLTDWSTDATYGSAIFGGTETIFRVGFNIGSFQRNAVEYLDSMQTNLLNGGDTIDFVPEPATWFGAALISGVLAVFAFRRAVARGLSPKLASSK